MEVVRASVDELFDKLGHVGAGGPFGGKVADLLFGGNLAGEEEPEETFWKRLLSTRGLGQDLLAVWNRAAAEADSLFRV